MTLAALAPSLAPRDARADDLAGAAPPAPAVEEDTLALRYERFRFASEGTAPLVGGGTTIAFLFVRSGAETAWRGGIFFDEGARNALRAPTEAGRRRAQFLSTIPYYAGLAYPYLVDALAVTAPRGPGRYTLRRP